MAVPATAKPIRKRRAPVPRRGTPLRDAIDDARFHEVAMLALSGVTSRSEMCERTRLSKNQLARILDHNRERFTAIYTRLRTELLGNLQAVALDERRDALLRDFALQARARTVAAKLLDEVEERIDKGVIVGVRDDGTPMRAGASARDLQVALGAARAFREPAGAGAAARGAAAATQVTVFAPTIQQVQVIQEAYREAGISLDDLVPVGRAAAREGVAGNGATREEALPAPSAPE